MIRPALILAGLAALALASPASAAGPKISSAASLDRDGDGHVDAVRVVFNAKVKGRGVFRVAGMRVVAAGKARGRRVTLRLAETAGCDLGLLPKVTYRSGLKSARGRRVRRSKLDMERRNGLGPRLTCAVTRDGDGDGRIDGLALTWSKRVSGGTRSAFDVEAYAITGLSRPSGRNITLELEERDATDSAAKPSVTYFRVAKGGVRGRRGQALPGAFKATRDGAGPVLAGAHTGDSDSDGLVDAVFADFSEPVDGVPGGLSVAGAEVTGVEPGDQQLTIGLVEGPLGTGARPQVSYGAGEVSDKAGNPAPAVALAADDAAAPVMTGGHSEDRSGDGQLDTLALTFSEAITHAADADGSYPLDVPGYGLAEVREGGGQSLEVALQQATSPDTGVRPSVRYTRGAGAPVLDAAGNEAASDTLTGIVDAAAPRLVGATTLDVDENGSLDRVRYRFSEPVSHSAPVGAFTAPPLTTLAAHPASGSAVEVDLQEAGVNTGVRPLAGYSPPGAGPVADLAGNLAPGTVGLLASDGAGPVMVDGTTGDDDSDNRIDRVEVFMSEPVTFPGDAVAPFAIDTEGYTVASIGAAVGNTFSISLVEPAQADTGGAPTVSYATGGSLRDLAGVEAVAGAYTDRTRDTLAPAFVAAETADADGNGRLDRVDLRYSEDVQGGAATTPFTVTGRSVTDVEFSGPRARIVIAEAGAPDTADTPSASYVPPLAPSERVRDLPKGPNDVPEDAPAQALVQAADKAGPAIVQAATGDVLGTADGRIDRVSLTFSEPVIHAAELTGGPFSITLGSPHSVTSTSAASGDSFTVQTQPSLQPDGGSKPTVTVNDPTKVQDAAGNGAPGATFSGTTDGVRPVLVSARLGEADGGGNCAASPPQDGMVDCLTVNWSEPVTHADDPSLTIGAPFSVSGTIPAVDVQQLTEVPLVEGSSPDRELGGTVAYTSGAPVPVLDAAGLEALSTTPNVIAEAACTDDLNEPNDSRLIDNPIATDVFPAYLCSADEDWWRVAPAAGELHVMMNAEAGRLLTLQVWDEAGGSPLATVTAAASGDPVTIDVPGPLAAPTYWLRIVGTGTADEGEYCLDTQFEPGDTCVGGGGDPI